MKTPVEKIAQEAMTAHRAGRFEQAEDLCREALDLDPTHFNSLVHLAVLLRNRGEFHAACEFAEQAISQSPHQADGYIQRALCLLGLGRPAESIPAFLWAISLSPPVAALHYQLGLALENVGRIEDAKKEFLEASRLDPRDVRARLSLGSLHLAAENINEARELAITALDLNPRSAEAHQFMAKVLVAQGEGAKAEESMRRSLEIDPDSSYGHRMLGFRLLQTGDFQGAEAECRRSIEIDPAQGVAYFGLTQARKLTDEDRPLVDQMLAVLRDTPLTLEHASYLHFGLGKAFDNLKEYERAMKHFDQAHETAHLLKFHDKSFDQAEYHREIDLMTRLYSKEAMEAEGPSLDTDLPVFIVGMMRSGTTLTEQIISSHRAVGAAGEQWFWAQRSHLAHHIDRSEIDRRQAVTLSRDYTKILRKAAPGFARVTDKLPGNYLRLGLIHLAMPKAKIIHCQRNPVDTALSIYFTANPVAPAYTHTKAGIAFVYRQYLKLMHHWRSVIPSERFHEIRYEELVSNPEPVIRGMLEFLGLPWDEACLSHDKNRKEVHTPSLWQVRQPMYSTSVDRWKRYEPWLGDLRQLLEGMEAAR